MAREKDPKVEAWFGRSLPERLRSRARGKGGFTADVRSGQDVASGYAVSDYGAEEGRKPGASGSQTVGGWIGAYAAKHRETLSRPGKTLGGWRTTEQGRKRDYLDVSTVHPSTEAGLTQARLGAMVHNQKQFVHLDSGEYHDNPAYESDPGAQARRIARMKGENVTDRPPRRLPRTEL